LATDLCSITKSQEDLSFVVKALNYFLELKGDHFDIEDKLRLLFQATRRDAIRVEYIRHVLEKAETNWYLGSSFND